MMRARYTHLIEQGPTTGVFGGLPVKPASVVEEDADHSARDCNQNSIGTL